MQQEQEAIKPDNTKEEVKRKVKLIMNKSKDEKIEWRKEMKEKLNSKVETTNHTGKVETPKPKLDIEEKIITNITKLKTTYVSQDRMMLYNLVDYIYHHLDYKSAEIEKSERKDKVYKKLLTEIQDRFEKKYKTQTDMKDKISKETNKILKKCKITADKCIIEGYILDYMTRLPK
jgi:hypothetical protein